MLMSKTWQQTAIYNPNDPTQRNRVVYASPGGWASFYWNRVADAGHLNGLGGFNALPQAAQIGIVTVAAAVVGYFGWRKLGGKITTAARPILRRVGLAGARRR